MSDSPTELSRVLDNQEKMAATLTDVQVKVERIDTSIEAIKSERHNTREDLQIYQQAHTREAEANTKAHEDIWKVLNNLTTWLKGMTVAWGILAVVLTAVVFLVK